MKTLEAPGIAQYHHDFIANPQVDSETLEAWELYCLTWEKCHRTVIREILLGFVRHLFGVLPQIIR
jgi:hypothetical protein